MDSTLAAWRGTGAIERADDAWIALARITADNLDAAETDPEASGIIVGRLTTRHLAALGALADRTQHRADEAPSLAELLASIPADADLDTT